MPAFPHPLVHTLDKSIFILAKPDTVFAFF